MDGDNSIVFYCVQELDKFLKLRKLEISALLFREVESDEPTMNPQEPAYPRKHARLQFSQPLDRIRDLRLPKKLELEKRKVNPS